MQHLSRLLPMLISVSALLLLLVSPPARAQVLPSAPTDVAVYLESQNGRLYARLSWTQTSAANEILVMRQPTTGYAMLVDHLLEQTAGAKSLLDLVPAEPNDGYYVREFVRDANGIVSEIGTYGPYQVSPPPTREDTGSTAPFFTQYVPFVAR